MLRRWLSTNRLLAQILAGLLLFVIGLPLSAGMEEWGREQYRLDFTEFDVLRAIDQYGADSPESADALRLFAEAGRPVDLVALLDPGTLRAIAAWPAANKGKFPDELTLSGGAKLPDTAALRTKFGQSVTTDRPNGERPGLLAPYETDKLETQIKWVFRNIETGSLTFSQMMPINPGAAPRVVVAQESPGQPAVTGAAERLQLQEDLARGRLSVRSLPPVAILLVAGPPRGFSTAHLLFIICLFLAMGGLALYWLSTAWWVFADARRRGARATAWGLLVLLTNVVGVLAYLIARPERLLCPSCGIAVERHHAHCTSCGQRLKDLCATCGMALQKSWRYCPGCGMPVASTPAASTPAARESGAQ